MKSSNVPSHRLPLHGIFILFFLAGLCALTCEPAAAAPPKEKTSNQQSLRAQHRASRVTVLANRSEDSRRGALAKAGKKRWTVRGTTPSGQTFELVGLGSRGEPLYHITNSTNATISMNASTLQGSPRFIDGAGAVIGIWDDGMALPTHQEFVNTGIARVINLDGAAMGSHATAVTGVAISGGVDAGCLGSASRAIAHNYDWFN